MLIELVLFFAIIYIAYFLYELFNKFKINRRIKKYEENDIEIPEIKPDIKLTDAQIRYQQYLKTEHWQNLRNAALQRAGYRCQVCGNEYKLQVHHNTYLNRGREEIYDLCVLCDECHNLFHNRNYYQIKKD